MSGLNEQMKILPYDDPKPISPSLLLWNQYTCQDKKTNETLPSPHPHDSFIMHLQGNLPRGGPDMGGREQSLGEEVVEIKT